MEKSFNFNYIRELADKISKHSLISYDDFPNYDLFISQVVEYLNDTLVSEEFTNNIIQNYIKSEVITKSEDGKKRGYNKTHLIQLVILNYMRPLLTTEEIKKVFKLAFNEINDSNDDILSWEETYKTFIKIQEESLNYYLIQSLTDEHAFEEIVEKFNLKNKDEDRIKIFLLVLSLISEASVINKLAQKIVNEYNHN
jgi:hypothetical protein